MNNALKNAKLKWHDASDFNTLGIDDSTLLGVEASGYLFVHGTKSNVSTLNIVGGVIVTKTPLGPSYKLMGSTSFMHVSNNDSLNGIDTIDVNILEGHAEAELTPLYAGAGIGFNLAGGEASCFDFNLGVGLSTGGGIKDESIEFKVAGTGVTVGRKISISVFDNSIGIDVVRTAQAAWFVGNEIFVAAAIVPGALKNSGEALLDEIIKTPGVLRQSGSGIWSEFKKIPGAFAPIPGAFADAGKQLGSPIADGAIGIATGVSNAASATADGIGSAVDTAEKASNSVADGVGSAVDSVGDAASEGISKVTKWIGW